MAKENKTGAGTPGEILREHLKTHLSKSLVCVICGKENFEVAGIHAVPNMKPDNEATFSNALVTISIACTNCYYLMSFAWLPIKRKAEGGQ